MNKYLLTMALLGAGIAQAAITSINVGGATGTTVSVNDQVAINGSSAGLAGLNNQTNGNGVNAGGLQTISFGGVNLFDVFDAGRDNGFMVGGGNFATNYIGTTSTQNTTVTGLTSSSTSISVAGTYLSGSTVLGTWTRTYTILANGIVREVVQFQNTSGSTLSNFRMFGSYDPDNGANTSTDNTEGTNSGFRFARAILSGGINSVLVSSDAGVGVGFFLAASPFTRSLGTACVDELLGSANANCLTGIGAVGGLSNTMNDYAYGWAQNFASILSGATVSTTVYHLFGTGGAGFDLTQAIANIGNPPPPEPPGGVPEPGTWAMMGSALIGLGVMARRRR